MASGRKTSLVVTVTPEEREKLESWQRSTTISSGLAKRGRIILLLADGYFVTDAARFIRTERKFVYKWAYRFQKHRIDGLPDQPGRGRKPAFPPRGGGSCGENSM